MSGRTSVIVIAAIITGSAGGYGLYRLGKSEGLKMAPVSSASSPAVDSSGRKVLYWHDPMVPGQRFDKPGKSPFMDMQLVPVYVDEQGNQGQVSVNPQLQQNL